MNSKKEIITDLGDGLVLRRATKEDTDALAKFNGTVHGTTEYATFLDIMVREMMSGNHPHLSPKDFTIVEEIETGKIVSSLNLIGQTWSYDGVEFNVGRPELVGTLEEYRRKGLVRKQMELVHQWSKERGHVLQGITGIPWYYRMFGYEMTVNFSGGRQMPMYLVPELKEDEKEIVTIRDAEISDIPFIIKLYEKSCERSLLACKRSKEMWEFDISGRYKDSMGEMIIKVIENEDKLPVGFYIHNNRLWDTSLGIFTIELADGVSWLETIPGIIRNAKNTAEEYMIIENEKMRKKKEEEKKEFKPKVMETLYYQLGEEHPFYDVFPHLLPITNNPYSWYIQVEDIPGFLNLIKPVLEKRLAGSYLVGYTGELKLNFYTYGIIVKFEKGSISSIEKWENPDEEKSCASFPNMTFLHILFGYKDLDVLTDSIADCFISRKKPEAKVLLKILFPKKASNIWPIE